MSNEYLLAAHLGGTKARLCLLQDPGKEFSLEAWKKIESRYTIWDFSDPMTLIKLFLKEAQDELRSRENSRHLPIKIKKACFAIAGPVDRKEKRCEMSNVSLIFDGKLTADKFINLGIADEDIELTLINDFEALAYAAKELKNSNNIQTLKDGTSQKNGIVTVIGAATGLGQSFLVHSTASKNDAEIAYPTEGGHTNFAPGSELEFALFKYIQKDICKQKGHKKASRVSAERVISGRGIVRIYCFLRSNKNYLSQDLSITIKQKIEENLQNYRKKVGEKILQNFENYLKDKNQEQKILQEYLSKPLGEFLKSLKMELKENRKSEEKINEIIEAFSEPLVIQQLIETWQREDERCGESVDPAAVIASAALRKVDPLCMMTMQIFIDVYIAEVRNHALQFLPCDPDQLYEGVYIAGGITPQIMPLIEENVRKLNDVFSEEFGMSKRLANVPVYVIKDLEAGLIGAASYVATNSKDSNQKNKLCLEQFEELQKGKPRENEPIGLIAAGEDLEEGFILPNANGDFYKTEGGLMDFAVRSDEEFELQQYIKGKYEREGIPRVPAKYVISERGIVDIYQFLQGREPYSYKDIIQNSYKDIIQNAINKHDKLCEKTMEIFVGAYAAKASNLALKLLCHGGLFLTGDIAYEIFKGEQKNWLCELFLDEFNDKGRKNIQQLIKEIPIYFNKKPMKFDEVANNLLKPS